MNVKFEDVEKKLITSLDEHLQKDWLLINGFLSPILSNKIDDEIELGGTVVPMVTIINKTTYELKFFALKGLLPELEI